MASRPVAGENRSCAWRVTGDVEADFSQGFDRKRMDVTSRLTAGAGDFKRAFARRAENARLCYCDTNAPRTERG